MPRQEVLVLAMTKMLSGICTAGFTRERDPVTGLRWVRPMRDHCTVQPGDMTDAEGHLVQCCDVVELNLVEPRPDPPHVEDWMVDFVYQRPRILRRLEGERRAQFFPKYLDQAPEEVLVHHTRSLCLVEPEHVWARFSLDAYSGKYEARMGFVLDGEVNHPRSVSRRGVSVTDLKWRALGRAWLGEGGGALTLDHEALLERLGLEALYLVVGLSRNWRGEYWPLVVGVHVVPDYTVPSPVPGEGQGEGEYPKEQRVSKKERRTHPPIVNYARELRRQQTLAEEKLWACLRNRQLAGLKFRRQHPIGAFIVDFYCAAC